MIFALALVPIGAAWLFARWFVAERQRPPLLSDDVTGDLPNLPESFLFHVGGNTDARA